MKAILIPIALYFLALLPCNAFALTILTEHSPPANYQNTQGELVGLSVDAMKIAMKRMGVEHKIEVMPWARGYQMTLEDEDTALFSTARTTQREKHFKWAGPLMSVRWALYVLKTSPAKIETLDDARKLNRIGTYHHDGREEFLIAKGFENLESVSSNILNLKKLIAGRIDAFATSNLLFKVGDEKIRKLGKSLREAFVFKKVDLYLAFSLDVPDEVVARWQKTFDEMRSEGIFDALEEKWIPQE